MEHADIGRRGLEETEGEIYGETAVDYGLGPLCLMITLGLICKQLAPWLSMPFSVLVLFAGMLVAELWHLDDGSDSEFHQSLGDWININPDLLATVLLPLLIFASAFSSSVHVMQAELWQFLWLALPMALGGAMLSALFLQHALPLGFDWTTSLLLGAIVSATDPIAVVAVLRELGVSEKLGTLIEGESLMNDGSAYVIFTVMLQELQGKERSSGLMVAHGLRLACGGVVLGMAMGALACVALGRVVNDTLTEICIFLVVTYGAWLLATPLQFSGVLTVVVLGLVMNAYGRIRVSPRAQAPLSNFWDIVDFVANIVIFFATGLIAIGTIAFKKRSLTPTDWGYMFSFVAMLYVIRAALVALSWPLLSRGEYGLTPKQGVVLVHSGLRGALSLILALIVDSTESIPAHHRDIIVLFVAGTSVLTLVVQGCSARPLIALLRMDRVTATQERAFAATCNVLETRAESAARHLRESEPFLKNADWSLVWRFVPAPNAYAYWGRVMSGRVTLAPCEVKDLEGAIAEVEKGGGRSCSLALHSLLRSARAALPLGAASTRLRYAHLPRLLRSRWARYTRRYAAAQHNCCYGATLQDALAEAAALSTAAAEAAAAEEEEKVAPEADVRVRPRPFVFGVPTSHHGSCVIEHPEELKAARLRFLAALHSQYTTLMLHGKLPGRALRALHESVEVARDKVDAGGTIDTWSYIQKFHLRGMTTRVVQSARFVARNTLLHSVAPSSASTLIQATSTFVTAHRAVVAAAREGNESLPGRIEYEVQTEVERASAALTKLEAEHPKDALVVKTSLAAYRLLYVYEADAEQLRSEARLTDKEMGGIEEELTEALKALRAYDW